MVTTDAVEFQSYWITIMFSKTGILIQRCCAHNIHGTSGPTSDDIASVLGYALVVELENNGHEISCQLVSVGEAETMRRTMFQVEW